MKVGNEAERLAGVALINLIAVQVPGVVGVSNSDVICCTGEFGVLAGCCIVFSLQAVSATGGGNWRAVKEQSCKNGYRAEGQHFGNPSEFDNRRIRPAFFHPGT